jgi:hypothetical protein
VKPKPLAHGPRNRQNRFRAARREIATDRDRSPVADVLTAMSLFRVLHGQTVDANFMRQVIDTLVRPALST